jgi:heat shock protein HslJ
MRDTPSLRLRIRRAARIAGLGVTLAVLGGCAGSVSLDEPLEGTPWRLVQLGGQSVAAGANPQTEPRVQFDAGGQRMSGSGGCNAISGNYRRNGSVLRIGPIVSTRRACADSGLDTLERRFVAVLEAATAYDVKGAQLTLLDTRSMPLAVLELGLRTQP